MPHPSKYLRAIHNFDELVLYLEEKLGWPLQEYGFDDLTFQYEPEELGLKEEDAAKVKAIHQLRPLQHGQPWGIFFVEFEKKKLPVVVLRRILSHLVVKKRASANRANEAAWHAEDLLFVTAFGEEESAQREIAFAHFHQSPGDMPTLRVLGWDGGDTPLKLSHLDAILHQRLQWPDDTSDHAAWRQQWRAPFKHRIGHVIRTADALAEALATLARGINDKAKRMLAVESDNGPLRKLHKAFQAALIHDLTEENFADTYAQTITYGLLTAAISRTEGSEGRHGTFIVAENVTDMVPVTNPFLKEMLQTFLKVGGRKGGIDFDELGIQDVVDLLRGDETDLPAILRDFGNKTQGEDPVIHFYEHFLSAYNKKLKVQRGVFYTPKPAVSYIVRSVHELLQTEFGLEDGLASTVTWGEMTKKLPGLNIPKGVLSDSPFVMVLDPATGTATFLVEVIDVIYKTITTKSQKQGKREQEIIKLWNEYIPKHLLPRLYGYELMMAPYAIAHMKIGLKLFETGYQFMSEERVRVYLTNALEPASDKQMDLSGIVPALAHEANAVNEVKRNVQFTVVVGNPPYAKNSSNRSKTAENLVKQYKTLVSNETNVQPLSDDYVKFIASMFSLSVETASIIGIITNRSYLDGLIHRGMRKIISTACSSVYVTDLHGDSNVGENQPNCVANENVFDITQGVAVSAFVRANFTSASNGNTIFHEDVWGTRSEKYALLQRCAIRNGKSLVTLESPYFFFAPKELESQEEQIGWAAIDKLFGVSGMGLKSRRDHFLIDQSREILLKRFEELSKSQNVEEQRTALSVTDNPQWTLKKMQALVQREGAEERIFPIMYRPFDIQFIWYHKEAIERGDSRWPVMKHLLPAGLSLLTSRQSVNSAFTSVFVARGLSEMKTAESTRGSYAYPVRLHGDILLNTDHGSLSNIRSSLLDSNLAKREPEEIFFYIYAILHSSSYRKRYDGALKIDFPRVPNKCPEALAVKLCKFGDELVALHLLESPKVNDFITTFTGKGDNSIPKKPIWKDNSVWINTTQSFEGVPENVWNFHIGGYQVCEKWLKDRKGRTLSEDDITHYQRIVVSLNETIRIMAEIDRVVYEHGGWPIK